MRRPRTNVTEGVAVLRLHSGARLHRHREGELTLTDDARALHSTGVPIATGGTDEPRDIVVVGGQDQDGEHVALTTAVDVLLHGAASGDRAVVDKLLTLRHLPRRHRALLVSLARSRRYRPQVFEAMVITGCVIAAVTRHSLALVVTTGVVLGVFAAYLGLPLGTAFAFALLPLLIPLVIGVHESAHWLTMVRVASQPQAGALFIRGQEIAVVTPRLDGLATARVAVAGPIAGVAVCTVWTGVWLAIGDPFAIGAGVILGATQMLGFTPLTKDGRALLGAVTSELDETRADREDEDL